ncbi:unnamed protein product [Rhodiola kirilowii]
MAKEEDERYFTEGTEVEVSMEQEGFRGSWYTATVITAPFPDAKLKNVLVTIEYKDLMEEDDEDEEEGTENAEKPQKEKDEDEESENAEKRLRETVDVVQIRPIPPREAKVEFKLNDWVDAFINDGWWEGVIMKVFGNGRFEVFFRASIELIEVREEDLRMHREWVYGDWIPPLLNEEKDETAAAIDSLNGRLQQTI